MLRWAYILWYRFRRSPLTGLPPKRQGVVSAGQAGRPTASARGQKPNFRNYPLPRTVLHTEQRRWWTSMRVVRCFLPFVS